MKSERIKQMRKTPYYIFDRNKIIKNYEEMKSNLYLCDIYYALKPNSDFNVLKILNELNSNYEVASIEELQKIQSLGVSSDKVICSLPIKSKEFIEYGYEYGCRYFVFDDIKELKKIIAIASDSKKILRIYIGDIIKNSIGYGMKINDFYDLCNNNPELIQEIDGITFYVSKNKNIGQLLSILNFTDKYLVKLNKENLLLNIGGNYRGLNEVKKDFYDKLNIKLEEMKEKFNLKLLAEPGHGIVKNTGSLVTKVIMTKTCIDGISVYIDAGTPTGVLFKPSEIELVSENEIEVSAPIKYYFYGITCSHQLLFSTYLQFNINDDDFLRFGNYGSYTLCMANDFHSWHRPNVYLIDSLEEGNI